MHGRVLTRSFWSATAGQDPPYETSSFTTRVAESAADS